MHISKLKEANDLMRDLDDAASLLREYIQCEHMFDLQFRKQSLPIPIKFKITPMVINHYMMVMSTIVYSLMELGIDLDPRNEPAKDYEDEAE